MLIIFFQKKNFWLKRVKGQKLVENDKNFCLSHSLSQEPYLIWLSFLIHMCKWWYLQQFFFVAFKILIFQDFSRGGRGVMKGQKITHNYQFQVFFFIFFKEICNIVNIKILTFFIFKFISKCQTGVPRCATLSSRVWFLFVLIPYCFQGNHLIYLF